MMDSPESSSTPHRVFLTGATGFLGHHTAEQLVADGHTVVALVRNPDSAAARRLPDAVEVVRGDVLDADHLRAAISAASSKQGDRKSEPQGS